MTKHLTASQWSSLSSIVKVTEIYKAGESINRRGTQLDHSLLLLEGLIARSIPHPRAERSTFVALQFPGDFVDLHAFPLKRLDHDVVSLTPATVARVDHAALSDLIEQDAAIARVLWSLTLVDASIHRHWVMRNSFMRALTRVANFFCEFDARRQAAVDDTSDTFPLGITQADIGDATGLSSIHVNRVLKDLREDGCCSVRSGTLTIFDRDRLSKRGDFDSAYLYLPGDSAKL